MLKWSIIEWIINQSCSPSTVFLFGHVPLQTCLKSEHQIWFPVSCWSGLSSTFLFVSATSSHQEYGTSVWPHELRSNLPMFPFVCVSASVGIGILRFSILRILSLVGLINLCHIHQSLSGSDSGGVAQVPHRRCAVIGGCAFGCRFLALLLIKAISCENSILALLHDGTGWITVCVWGLGWIMWVEEVIVWGGG